MHFMCWRLLVAFIRSLLFLCHFHGPVLNNANIKGLTTYVADTLDRPAHKASGGSLEGIPLARCPGRPSHQHQRRIDQGPGLQQAGSRSGVVGVGHRQDTKEADRPVKGLRRLKHQSGFEPRRRRQRVRAPQRPCVGLPPPSCGPSTPCEFP